MRYPLPIAQLSLPLLLLAAVPGFAAEALSGPVLDRYGANLAVQQTHPVTPTQRFKVAFDVSSQAQEGQVNRGFDSLARFINMHVRHGVPLANLELALVVHGSAGFDLLQEAAHKRRFARANVSGDLVTQLMEHGVRVILCGQSAGFQDISRQQLIPGVELSLSAMTAHALLQQAGYSLNPF